MTFPNMSDALSCFEESITFKITTTVNNADYKKEVTTVDEVKRAVIQSARPQDLKLDGLDWSLQYSQMHSVFAVSISDRFNWNGKDYKIISVIDQSNRGFYESIGEEVK